MYDYISGTLVSKKPTEIVVDASGIGYSVKISLSTYNKVPEVGQDIIVKSYLHVREDILQLYGFSDEHERDVFLSLIGVSGIGPKLAQTVLSGLTYKEFIQAIQTGDEKKLNTISGVGKKTAQRLVVELQDKFGKIETELAAANKPGIYTNIEKEAILALLSLGYARPAAEKALKKAQNNGSVKTVEELLKQALQVI
jgi:Holliday junction DNA helicase RuvA